MLVIPMDDANAVRIRFMYMMFMFLIFMMFSPNPPNPYRMQALKDQANREQQSLDALANATFSGSFEIPRDLNITGANVTVPEYVRREVESLSPKPVEEGFAYFSNVTGVVRGKWHRIPEPNKNPFLPPELPPENEERFTRVIPAPREFGNTTYHDTIVGNSGKFTLDLSETKQNDTIQFVEGTLTINKGNGDHMYNTKLQGVHFPRNGEVVLVSTTARKFEGLTLLPFLASNNATFASVKDLVYSQLLKSMDKHSSYQSSEEDEMAYRPLQCDVVVFLSVLPLFGISPSALSLYESEMRFPTGQTIVHPPSMELSGVIYSPDCGTALSWRDEKAIKVEKFWHAGRTIGLIAGCIAGVQVWWVLKEMAERGSPSSVSKVSFWTVAMQALMSGYLCGIYLVTAILLENIAVPLLATTFMAFVLMIYELRFLGLIFRVQRPERPVNRTAMPIARILPIRRGDGTPQNTPATTALNTSAPNTPATATVLPTPEDSPSPSPTTAEAPAPTAAPAAPQQTFEEQFEPDTRSEYFIITKYFYVSVLSLFILTSWLSSYRILTHLLLLALHSFWVPQVYRNVMRGVRKALGWRYVFGMTISRGLMAVWLIWYQRGDWVFLWESEDSDTIWGWILLGWLWFQVAVLIAQEIFGPRFFISANVHTTLNLLWDWLLILVTPSYV